MTSQPSTINTMEVTTTALERALEELDQVIHRSKALLQRVHKPSMDEQLQAWEAGCGLWKGKITEDPVAYQRRIRDEEDI